MISGLRSAGRVAWRAFVRFNDHAGSDRAAGVAFYALLSLLPLLVLLVSLASRLLGSYEDAYASTLYLFRGVVVHLDERSLDTLHEFTGRARTLQIGSLLLLAWTSRRIFAALFSALEGVFEVPTRGFAKGNLLALAMVPGFGLGLLVTVTLTMGVATAEGIVERVAGTAGADAVRSVTGFLLGHVLPPAMAFTFFFIIYWVVPRRVVSSRDAALGAGLATLLWEAAKGAFAYYVRDLASYSDLYGTLEAIIVLALWLELSVAVILYCGEVVAVRLDLQRDS